MHPCGAGHRRGPIPQLLAAAPAAPAGRRWGHRVGSWSVLYGEMGCPVWGQGVSCMGTWGVLYGDMGCPVWRHETRGRCVGMLCMGTRGITCWDMGSPCVGMRCRGTVRMGTPGIPHGTGDSLRGAGGGKEAREAGCNAEGLCVCSGLRCEQGTRSCSLQPGQSLAMLLTVPWG